MISESNTGVIAEEWFERLPSEQDRRTVTGIVALAHEFERESGRTEWDDRHSLMMGYLGVYAIGSRSLGQEDERSDIDILVAHNLSFMKGAGRCVNFTKDVIDLEFVWPHKGGDPEDPNYLKYMAASDRETNFNYRCIESDPVSSAVCTAVAASADEYRLPHTFDGNLPDNYGVGGRDHKAFVRYKSDSSLSALDLIFYKGWHSDKNPTDEEIEESRRLSEQLGDNFELQRSICGPKCKEVCLNEGANQAPFEQVIDTDNFDNQLSRVPLYTFGDGEKKIYIPQIEDLVKTEQIKVDDHENGWDFRRSWAIHPVR